MEGPEAKGAVGCAAEEKSAVRRPRNAVDDLRPGGQINQGKGGSGNPAAARGVDSNAGDLHMAAKDGNRGAVGDVPHAKSLIHGGRHCASTTWRQRDPSYHVLMPAAEKVLAQCKYIGEGNNEGNIRPATATLCEVGRD
jgi:hypothetical protein